jgi:hypothetical protein
VVEALLVHSPLVGPATVRRLAASLATRGWSTTVPDLRAGVVSPGRFAAFVVELCPSAEIVVGHSGAGAFLPWVTERVGARSMVFVDAVLPGTDSEFLPSGSFTSLLANIPTVDGRLAPWHQWWPPEAMARLVPDEELRREVVAEIPRVPRSFYDEPVPVPHLWWMGAAAYLQLSPAYDRERERAEAWGWPTGDLGGGHLDPVTRPDDVADGILRLVQE